MTLLNGPKEAPNEDIVMSDLHQNTTQRNKRNHTNIETNNSEDNTGKTQETPKTTTNKKQYTAQGMRRDTTDLRIDFPSARTRRDA